MANIELKSVTFPGIPNKYTIPDINPNEFYIENDASGRIASFSDGANDIAVKEMIIDINPIQASGTPSPKNPKEITGSEKATITRFGKNLYKSNATSSSGNGLTWTANEDGTLTVNGTATANSSKTLATTKLKKGEYIISGCPFGGTSSTYELRVLVNGAVISARDYGSGVNVQLANDGNIAIRIYVYKDAVLDNVIFKPMIRVESDPNPAFEPYQEKVYEVAFPSAEGTVYSGKLNVTTGELTVDGLLYTFGSSDSYSYVARSGSSVANIRIMPINTGDFARRSTMISNQYKTITTGATTDKAIRLSNTGITLIVYDSRFTDEETAHAITAANPIQVFYPIADPITYQLTPTEITTLLGDNNILADTGDIDLTYRADAKLYINEKLNEAKSIITDVELSSIATKNYSVGDMLIVEDTLYKVTAAITAGDTISADTNVTATTVAEELIARG